MTKEVNRANTTPNLITGERSYVRDQGIAVLVVGLSIGWLTGLSYSPVVSAVISGILGIGAGVVAGLQATRAAEAKDISKPSKSIDARPAAFLALGIALAAPCGILARDYKVFSPDQAWEEKQPDKPNRPSNASQGGLFKTPADECDELLKLAGAGNNEAFVGQLKGSQLPGAKEYANRIDDLENLRIVVEILCNSEDKHGR